MSSVSDIRDAAPWTATLGARVKSARNDMRISQHLLATTVNGISQTHHKPYKLDGTAISRIERGVACSPRLRRLLAAILELELTDLGFPVAPAAESVAAG